MTRTPLNCLFNPKEYTVSKTNTWNAKQSAGVGLPKVQFGGGAPQEMSFEILLDDLEGTYDVGADLDRLFLMMETDSQFATARRTARGRRTSPSRGAARTCSRRRSSHCRFNTCGSPPTGRRSGPRSS